GRGHHRAWPRRGGIRGTARGCGGAPRRLVRAHCSESVVCGAVSWMGTGRTNAHAMNTIDTPISTRPTHQLASVLTYRSTRLSVAALWWSPSNPGAKPAIVSTTP